MCPSCSGKRVAPATLGLRREAGVQTETKIDGGRRSLLRASGDRLFLAKCAEGGSPKPREGSKPYDQDAAPGLVHESPIRKGRAVDVLKANQVTTGQNELEG